MSEGTIYLNLMRYEDGGYQNAGQDTITNRDMEESQRARISTVKSQDKQTQVVLEWPQSEDTGRISERTAKLIIPESSIERKWTAICLPAAIMFTQREKSYLPQTM